MSASLSQLSQELLNALDSFDEEALPLGLYACEEFQMRDKPYPRLYQEWVLCLAPCLERFGFKPFLPPPSKPNDYMVREGKFSFRLPDKKYGEFHIVRTSKVKVRRFGSAYKVDARAKYAERWRELRLDRRLTDLWKPSSLAESPSVGLRLFLLIGFARENEPFGKELTALESQLEWENQNVEYATRIWNDREGRAFFVRTSLWASEYPLVH
jgi:hypothetical protein